MLAAMLIRRTLLAAILLLCTLARAQNVGECVRLKATRPEGVPRHSRPENSFAGRIADGAIVPVVAHTPDKRWYQVISGTVFAWVSAAYIDAVVPCPGGTPVTPAGIPTVTIGTWNIEHFKEGTPRGFPELPGRFPARADADYQTLADIILGMDAKILVLNEVNGKDSPTRSPELERLLAKVGPTYDYVLGTTGNTQRIAIIFDTACIHLDSTREAALPEGGLDDEDEKLFARQPLLARFTIFQEGVEMSDLVVVGLHLASDQRKTANHRLAMQRVEAWIAAGADGFIPAGECDILIAGDLNASRFDTHDEGFFESMEAGPWDVLADTTAYPPTRLTSKFVLLQETRIDYIIISRGPGCLSGNDIPLGDASVHTGLVERMGGGMEFRRRASDHLPVTVGLRVRADDD